MPFADDAIDFFRIVGIDHGGQCGHHAGPEVMDAFVGAVAADARRVDLRAFCPAAGPRGNAAAQQPLLEQTGRFVRHDLPGAVELLDLLLLPHAFALLAHGRFRADHRTGRRQLVADNGRDRIPDPFGFRRTTGQVVVDLHGLIERAQCVVEHGQVQFAFGHFRPVLRLDMVRVLGRRRVVVHGVEDLSAVAEVGQSGDAAFVGARAERHQDFGFLAQQLRHVLLLAGADAAVEQADVDFAVRHLSRHRGPWRRWRRARRRCRTRPRHPGSSR